MREPLDGLQASSTPVLPDAAFRAELMAQLAARLDARLSVPAGGDDDERASAPDVRSRPASEPRRPWRAIALAMVAGAAVLLLGVMVRSPGNEVDPGLSPSVLDVPPSRPPITPASTTATPTVAVVTASDEEIAAAVLLDAEEYGEGWIQTAFKDVVLDRSLAAQVPACAPYLDTVFEGPVRPADSALRHFYLGSVPAATRQYVLVFPTDAAAGDFFDATATPTFRGDCLEPYRALTVEVENNSCCNSLEPGTPPLWGARIESGTVPGADQSELRLSDAEFWTDEDGVRHGPEEFIQATVRVGRVVAVIEAILTTETGVTVFTPEHFQGVVERMTQRAGAALVDPSTAVSTVTAPSTT